MSSLRVKLYWSGSVRVDIGNGDGEKDYAIELYTYAKKTTSIVLKCEEEFGKSFAEVFKSYEGRFNASLSLPNENGELIKTPGWIFFLTSNDTSKINSMLSGISDGSLKPKLKAGHLKDFKLHTSSKEHIWDKLMATINEISFDDKVHSEQYGNNKMVWGPIADMKKFSTDGYGVVAQLISAHNMLMLLSPE